MYDVVHEYIAHFRMKFMLLSPLWWPMKLTA